MKKKNLTIIAEDIAKPFDISGAEIIFEHKGTIKLSNLFNKLLAIKMPCKNELHNILHKEHDTASYMGIFKNNKHYLIVIAHSTGRTSSVEYKHEMIWKNNRWILMNMTSTEYYD